MANKRINRALSALLAAGLLLLPEISLALNRSSQGTRGLDAHWPTAAKTGFGTSTTISSKVWFTLADGVLSEVFYPRLDVPNVQCLQLLVVGAGTVETEVDDTIHKTEIVDANSLEFRQINEAKSGRYKITKTYVTDPDSNTLLIDIQLDSDTASRIYLYFDPSLKNSGMHDTGWMQGDALLAQEGDVSTALTSSAGFEAFDNARGIITPLNGNSVTGTSSGYLGVNDGLTELRQDPSAHSFASARAEDGNVVQVAMLRNLSGLTFVRDEKTGAAKRSRAHTTLALGFGSSPQVALDTARRSLAKGFARTEQEYRAGWNLFASHLPRVEAKYQKQLYASAMVLRALEDKTFRGAFIASPTVPWGGGPNANEPTISGYHAVWARDLYHIATALMALNDLAAARRALDYLLTRQQKPDGSFPQNTWVDGRPIGQGMQMDQVALPIVLAYQLGRTDPNTWRMHLRPAADYIVEHGPATNQDRWEEKSGYSPSTIAAQIAGLVCAAQIATINKDTAAAQRYRSKADAWARDVDRWTQTSTGRYDAGGYFLRISNDGNPNDGAMIEINSGGGSYDERDIVDSGFLELVRLGIKRPNDEVITRSVKVIDQLIRVRTPYGPAWYRYNHDAYGETSDGRAYDGRSGIGRLWTLLTGERGEFELARGNISGARECLDALQGFANEGSMIAEQVWDRPGPGADAGRGTGSATPLAWSMAQFIRLAMNIRSGRNLETPKVVVEHFRPQ